MKGIKLILLGAAVMMSACSGHRETAFVPLPGVVSYGNGAFDLTKGVKIERPDALGDAADYLRIILEAEGVNTSEDNGAGAVSLNLDNALAEQEYHLTVDSRRIDITGGSYAAVITGIATLRQMLWTDNTRIAAAEISDSPRFPWRGLMLDVSRHFFPVSEVKVLIDQMANYKLNRLHLHLTDDQGWRVEIKALPGLTEVGAWRKPNNQDERCLRHAEETGDTKFLLPEERFRDGLYGGYYSQDDVRELVAYAAQRGIEVIPEIDLPGHSLAILRSYPHLSCDGKGGAWGESFSTPLCLGNEEVMEFTKEVLKEVFSLFPSKYIHLGGDEVDIAAWEKCPRCRARVAAKGLGDASQLQAWFTREMEDFCRENGKVMFGWDEVADDGLKAESNVMWWRHWVRSSLAQALEDGHNVVISTTECLYLSPNQDRGTLPKIYGYEPGDTLVRGHEHQVMGIQGHVWTEEGASFDAICERIFPRLLAIAETGWTAKEARCYDSFKERLAIHLEKLGANGIKYRFPDVTGVLDKNVFLDKCVVDLGIPDGATLHYTLDGSLPDPASSMKYVGPISIEEDAEMKFRCYDRRGVPGELKSALFIKSEYLPAVGPVDGLKEGITATLYDSDDMEQEKEKFDLTEIVTPEGVSGSYALVFDGYLDVPDDDVYSFYAFTEDKCTVTVDGQTVVDGERRHSYREFNGQAALARGLHKLKVTYSHPQGGPFRVGMTNLNGEQLPFPKGMLKHLTEE